MVFLQASLVCGMLVVPSLTLVNVYPGADTTFSLYQDSGDGYAFEQGDYSLSLLAWDDSKQKLKLKAVKKSRIYNREIKVNVVKCFPTKP